MAAVFLTDNEVGSGTLVIIGGLLALVALAGAIPRRVSLGGTDVEFLAGQVTRRATRNATEQVAKALGMAQEVAEAPEEQLAVARRVLYEWEPSFSELHKPAFILYREMTGRAGESPRWESIGYTKFGREIEGWGSPMATDYMPPLEKRDTPENVAREVRRNVGLEPPESKT